VGPIRRRLGFRTLFNCLGPLLNPARAPFQLLGVGRPEWLDPLAGALARLGVRRAFVVCGSDGLDDVTLGRPTWVRDVQGGSVVAREWAAADFGLEPCDRSELCVDTAEHSGRLIEGILEGRPSPGARVVLANAAAALLATGQVASLAEGVER